MPRTRTGEADSAPDEHQLQRLILEILDENHLMSVATVRSDGWPQVTIVNYLRKGHALYFVTARESQKYANLMQDSRVSVAIGGGGEAGVTRGLSMAARAAEVLDASQIKDVNDLIGQRAKDKAFKPHPLSSLVAVMELRPQIISVVDYSAPPGRRDLVQVIEEWRVRPLADER